MQRGRLSIPFWWDDALAQEADIHAIQERLDHSYVKTTKM
jgi:hypothetical protein